MLRIGHGYDVHRLVPGRELILGGVKIAHDKGLDGHSDADVLIHAAIDALLGALVLGDIGSHFPDTDPEYAGIDSRKLLREVFTLVKQRGYLLLNLDSTICAQSPRLRPFIDLMRANLAADLQCSPDQVSVKATTEEGLGVSGGNAGISATCVVLLKKVTL